MNIAELSVRRPVAISMVFILVCVIAMVFIPGLGIDLYPSIEFPILSVITTYPGVGPEEIDQNVTEHIVDAVKGVPGIVSVNSTSQENMSMVIIEFGFDEDMDEAFDNVNAELATVTRLIPDDADVPTLMSFDISATPMMRLGIDGDLSIDELNDLAEDTISPLIERIDGVSSVEVKGGAEKIIKVSTYHNRLEAYGISLGQIVSALAARNIQISSGEITRGGLDYEIITTEYFGSLDDIRETVVTTIDGSTITVADIANTYEALEDDVDTVYINGNAGLYISVSKENDANASAVAKQIRAQLEDMNAELPDGVTLSVLSDDTTLIDSTMNQVYSAGFEGIVLASLIILLFLRNIKSAFIIVLTMPISILMTLMIMAFMDLTINMMTMAGLILGIGMVVDSSIVILENIFVYREKGMKSVAAAILGSRTMINAIVASTLTTLCVFIPILIYKADLEMLGVLFQDMIITVCASLSASLIVAITLVPALCGSILQIETKTQKQIKNKFLRNLDEKFAVGQKKLENAYAVALEFSLKNKLLVISFVVLTLIVSVMQLGNMGISLAPPAGADDKVDITLEFPIGTNLEVVEEYLFRYQEIVKEEVDSSAYENIILSTGSASMFSSAGSEGQVQINLPELSEQTLSADDIKNILRPFQNSWSGIKITFAAGRGIGGGNEAIDVEIISEDAEAAEKIGLQVENLLREMPMLTDVATDFSDGSPRYQIRIDAVKAALAGVSVQSIASEIKNAVSGTVATVYRAKGEEYDLEVSLRDEDIQNTSDLGNLAITTPNGRVALDNFIIYVEGKAPQSIMRTDGERKNSVTAGVSTGFTSSEAQVAVEEIIEQNIVLPENVKIEFGGESQDIEQMLAAFIIVIFLAIFLVFAVMAAQFESLIDPFIIFASIPLLGIGVILIYLITGQQLTVFSMVGVVALVGIVVNNGIVLVDYTNQLVDKRMPIEQACVEAGRNRLQPILMSTLTTVLGMVPLAFFPGEGAEMMQPIALTMVGGLLSGSFMTLFISPVLYSMMNKKRLKRFDNPNSLINQIEEFDNSQN